MKLLYPLENPRVIASQISGLFLRMDNTIKRMTKKVKTAPLIIVGRNFFITTIVILLRDYSKLIIKIKLLKRLMYRIVLRHHLKRYRRDMTLYFQLS